MQRPRNKLAPRETALANERSQDIIGTTRRLQESAPVVVAGYSIGVKSQNVAEASAIANILKDSRQLTTQMYITPPTSQKAPYEIELAWDTLSNTYVTAL